MPIQKRSCYLGILRNYADENVTEYSHVSQLDIYFEIVSPSRGLVSVCLPSFWLQTIARLSRVNYTILTIYTRNRAWTDIFKLKNFFRKLLHNFVGIFRETYWYRQLWLLYLLSLKTQGHETDYKMAWHIWNSKKILTVHTN